MLAFAMLFMAACGGAGSSAAPSSSAPASSAPAAEGTIQGTVVDATMGSVTIQVPNGSEYTFNTEGAEISSPEGILLGDTITVHYVGQFKESQQDQDVSVSSIFVDAEGAAQAPATDEEGFISGTIVDASMSTLKIATSAGAQYQFATEGATVNGSLVVGETVAIKYTGVLDTTTEQQSVAVNTITVTGGTPAAGKPSSSPVEAIRGTIDQLGDGTIMVSDATGVGYLFDITQADIHAGGAGLAEGDTVTVYYVGSLYGSTEVQNVKVTEVVLDS